MSEVTKSAHERYLFKPFPCSSHSWVMKELRKLPGNPAVLDVGPGSGAIGDYLREEQGVSELYAVEIDAETVKELEDKGTYKEISCSIDSFKDRQFDCILLMDLLEHLSHPFAFLKEVSSLLKPGGIICISVPNVAHWSVRFPLLFGFFEYTGRGILDKTHLQFFNRRRFKQLLTAADNCEVDHISESLEPVEFVLPGWMTGNPVFKQLRQIQLALGGIWPGLIAYQHLGVVKKKTIM